MIVLKIVHDELNGPCCVVCPPEPMPLDASGKLDSEAVRSIVGCQYLNTADIGHGITVWFDDEAIYTKNMERNQIATALRTLYWVQNADRISCPCDNIPICGNVVLLGSADSDGNTLDLNDEQVAYLDSLLHVKSCPLS